jgi:hypothetical protein
VGHGLVHGVVDERLDEELRPFGRVLVAGVVKGEQPFRLARLHDAVGEHLAAQNQHVLGADAARSGHALERLGHGYIGHVVLLSGFRVG